MGNADVVLVIMVLFTLVAFPLVMLGHCTAILRFTPSKAPDHVSAGLWFIEGSVNETLGSSDQFDPKNGHFHGPIRKQIKYFVNVSGFDNPTCNLSLGSAANVLTCVLVLILLILQICIYAGLVGGPVYLARNRVAMVVFSSLSLLFGIISCLLMYLLVEADLTLMSQLNRERTALTSDDLNYGWLLLIISDGARKPQVIQGGHLSVDYAFVTPIVGVVFLFINFILSFAFSVAAKGDRKAARTRELLELQREKDKSKETEKLVGTTQNYNTADIPTYSQIEQQRQQKQQQQQQQQQPQLQQETK